jgi:hypothetical protein
MCISADLVPGSPLAERYASLITGATGVHLLPRPRPSCATARSDAGGARPAWLNSRRGSGWSKSSTPAPNWCSYAQLRADCEAAGHALAQREHNADRRIAATAIRLANPLVSADGIFRHVPGLTPESLPAA